MWNQPRLGFARMDGHVQPADCRKRKWRGVAEQGLVTNCQVRDEALPLSANKRAGVAHQLQRVAPQET